MKLILNKCQTLCVGLLILFSFHLSAESALTPEQQQWLANNNRLTFSAAAKARPFSYINRNNEFAGVSADIIARLEQHLGIEAFYKPSASWAEALAMLRTGQIDFIPWIYITEPRTQHFLFSEPYLIDELVLFTRSDFHYVSGLDDMQSHSLAVLRDSAVADVLARDYPQIELITYNSIENALEGLATGQTDGIVHSNAIIEQLLRLSDIDNIEFAATTPYRFGQAFAVHPAKAELVPLLNQVIAVITEQERALLLDKWTNVRVVEKQNWQTLLLWLGLITLLAAVAVGVITIRNRRVAFLAVQKSEVLLASAQRMAGMASWQWQAVDDSMIWSGEGGQMIGLPHNRRVTRRGYLQLVHPEDQLAVKQRWAHAVDKGVYQSEHRLLIDGKVKWIREIAELDTDSEGNLEFALGTTQDIHDQKLAELQQAESADKLQKLTAKLIHVQEEERRRVAAELHDDFGQRLAALSIDVGGLELDPDIAPARDRVAKLKANLIQVAADAHDLSRRLHPAMIDDLGLADALTTEVESFIRRESIDVAFHVSKQLPELSSEARLSLFRIVQEALDNVAKYACASMVQVSLEIEQQRLILQVMDDGVGFDVEQAMKSPGIGLQSMMERAKLIGAELAIAAELNQGATVELTMALAAAKAQ
ncbi:transporter substrate-binding domain-containing protein [Neiella sp. HB171785]|uniref:Transporter substrate-binding domain-containing protein n=1 Tax=Neiella litorisoli TaxID=2771431 RepID=A0A8J6QRJ5_9GAMM|nr:transporter substrate-binding domain-containing protein [Neiella litorisoli]MBD1390231.1 transporter substrate-binding domain-containing protein [Neiella litorisoli]